MSNLDTAPTPQEGRIIEIHGINVKQSKSLASIDLFSGKDVHKIRWQKKDSALQAVLDPPGYLSGLSCFSLRLHYRFEAGSIKVPYKKSKTVTVNVQQLLLGLENEDGDGQTREIRQEYGETEVTIMVKRKVMNQEGNDTDATKLQSTTEGISRICPQFRILIIGKSGVGKSSLINKVFGVPIAMVSDLKPGEADINHGFIPDQNKRLVLHDSRGFEPGEIENFRLVEQFIESRSKEPHIKDRLHAVWLCLEIPSAGGRVIETGVEEFLNRKVSGKLGSIPVIAVFTKYDELVDRAEFSIDSERTKGLSDEAILKIADEDAKKILETECIEPFKKGFGDKIPYIIVSTKKGYEDKIDGLVELTYRSVEEHVSSEPSIVSAMAQRPNPSVKINASIAVGKKKYWKGLASGTNFPGQSLKNCLTIIHLDIIAVWNFDDPHRYLRSIEFEALMYSLVDNLSNRNPSNPTRILSVGLSMVGTIAGIVSALAGPAAPIVVPIAASTVLVAWLYEVYKQSDETLQRLMAYIVDLTLIMQNLFLLAIIDHHPVNRRLIKLAFKAYRESPVKDSVHSEIREYVKRTGVVDRVNRDGALDKIVELIERNRIESAEMRSLRGRIGDIDSLEDEPWDVEQSESRVQVANCTSLP